METINTEYLYEDVREVRDNDDKFIHILNNEIQDLINAYNDNEYEEVVRDYVCNMLTQIRSIYHCGSGNPKEFMDTLIETQCIVADSLQALRKIISFSFHSKNVEL